MTPQQQPQKSLPALAQDDFEWGEEAQSSRAPKTAAKTTELDRIEFEVIEKAEIKKESLKDDSEDKSRDSGSIFGHYFNLFFTSKLLMLTCVLAIVLTALIGGVFILFSGVTNKTDAVQMDLVDIEMPAAYERTLSDFIVPTHNESDSAFVSYKVRLLIKSTMYDYYLAKEQRIRADIFQILKQMRREKNIHNFSEAIQTRANALFEETVVEAASLISEDKI